jgi:hypothetical protein
MYSDLVMTAQHIERASESYVIEIRGQDKVDTLLNREFERNFVNMAHHLKIMNRRMVLLNPKFMQRKQ